MKIQCLICGHHNIEIIMGAPEFDSDNVIDVDNNIFSNGIVDKIHAGYGSSYDGKYMTIAICDQCMDERKDRIIHTKDYM